MDAFPDMLFFIYKKLRVTRRLFIIWKFLIEGHLQAGHVSQLQKAVTSMTCKKQLPFKVQFKIIFYVMKTLFKFDMTFLEFVQI